MMALEYEHERLWPETGKLASYNLAYPDDRELECEPGPSKDGKFSLLKVALLQSNVK
jgi:hypothetical protein